jgi:hypothetical protein
MPATPLRATIGDVLAWDRERGEPSPEGGFTAEQEAEVLAQYGAPNTSFGSWLRGAGSS